jgi:hypothetical protein
MGKLLKVSWILFSKERDMNMVAEEQKVKRLVQKRLT